MAFHAIEILPLPDKRPLILEVRSSVMVLIGCKMMGRAEFPQAICFSSLVMQAQSARGRLRGALGEFKRGFAEC